MYLLEQINLRKLVRSFYMYVAARLTSVVRKATEVSCAVRRRDQVCTV